MRNKFRSKCRDISMSLNILFLDKFVGAGKILISEFQSDILRLVW